MKGSVLLCFPPIGIDMGGGIRFERAAVPPLGMLYLAAPLIDSGYDVEFADFAAEGFNEVRLRHLMRGKDVIGISMLTFDRRASTMIIDQIHELTPSVPIIVGGQDLTLEPRLPENVDVAVIGEADHSIVQIIDAVVNGEDLSLCPGVIFRDRQTGEIKEGQPSIVPAELDDIRFPSRHLINRTKYTFLGKAQAGRIASIITSRGCPYRCTYCVVKSSGQRRYRERSPENVLAEIEEIADSGYGFLFIIDNNFFVNRRRVHAIMDGILDRNIKLRIAVQGRVDLVDEALIRKMKEAGLRVLSCGFESGCQDVLDFYDKGTTVEQNREVISLAEKHGIYTFGNFILGAPIETHARVQKTIEFAERNPLDAAKYNTLWYIYGSSIWDRANEEGLIHAGELCVLAAKERDLSHFTIEELQGICFRANRDFYQRPSYLMMQIRKGFRVGREDPYLVAVLVRALLGYLVEHVRIRISNALGALANSMRASADRFGEGTLER